MSSQFFAPDMAVAADLEEQRPLKVVGVYADLPAHVLGMRILRDVARQCLPVCDIDAAWWSFDTLKSADVHETAARAARDADMIWCSAHACEALPHAVRAWLDNSAQQKRESDAALVALLRCPADYKVEHSPARTYLSRTAQAAGMQLFVQRFDCGCRGLLNSPPTVSVPRFNPESMRHTNCQQFRHWGINE